MAAELAETRKDALFNSAALTNLLWRPRSRRHITHLVEILQKEPLFQKFDKFALNRRQLLLRALKGQVRLLELQKQYRWSRETLLQAVVLLDDPFPFTLHFTAFMSVIENQATEEQVNEWIPKCEKMEVLGCYAQTELGHGSNVQGLETRATYVSKTDEFEVDSPTLTSAKWWIGGLGVMATHALVQASLIVNSRNYGPHLFIVPVRSQTTMQPLPNVTVGDIGSKAFSGFSSIDNGFLRFNKVRIPRKNMLQRYSQVTRDGKFIAAKQAKLSYGSMITLRVSVVSMEAWNLARALTIAVRYTNIRRQFSSGKGGKEEPVINYSSVKFRLFPLLGVTFAYLFAAQGLLTTYLEMVSELNTKGESTRLGEVHALSSGLKACATWDCLAGMEEARKVCGGHGFSAYSGIGHIWANGVASQTYEGDNYVISQQTARACLKYLANPSNLPSSAEYLSKSHGSHIKITSAASWTDHRVQVSVLERRARNAIMALGKRIQQGNAWNDLNIDCVNVSRAHVEVSVLHTFIDLHTSLTDLSLLSPLTKLCNLYALHTLTKTTAELLTFEIITGAEARWLADAYRDEILNFTPREAVQITDAFGFTDYELGSVLGRYDGKVYENLWTEVQKNSLNAAPELKEEVLKMIHGVSRRESRL